MNNTVKMALVAMMAMHAHLCVASTARAEGLGDMDAGLKYARQRCAECHDIASRNPMTTASDAPTFHVIANKPGISRTSLSSWLLSSHPKMPGLMIEPADLDNVIAFILSLKDE